MIEAGVIGGFFDSLSMFFSSLLWSIALAAIGIFVLLMIILFQHKSVKTPPVAEDFFRRLRLLVIALPVFWVFVRWGDHPNALSSFLFGVWLPVVLFMLLALSVIELGALPVYRNAKIEGERLGNKAVPKKRKSKRRRK